jgi:hypothetical protein
MIPVLSFAATSLNPSDEQAMDCHWPLVALVCVQVDPPFVEV